MSFKPILRGKVYYFIKDGYNVASSLAE